MFPADHDLHLRIAKEMNCQLGVEETSDMPDAVSADDVLAVGSEELFGIQLPFEFVHCQGGWRQVVVSDGATITIVQIFQIVAEIVKSCTVA